MRQTFSCPRESGGSRRRDERSEGGRAPSHKKRNKPPPRPSRQSAQGQCQQATVLPYSDSLLRSAHACMRAKCMHGRRRHGYDVQTTCTRETTPRTAGRQGQVRSVHASVSGGPRGRLTRDTDGRRHVPRTGWTSTTWACGTRRHPTRRTSRCCVAHWTMPASTALASRA